MKIHFARHGESQANVQYIISNRTLEHGLTENGREQARQLARRLLKYPITRIYTSPLLRAVETAEIISQMLGLACELAEGLREFDCGVAEGRSDDAAWQLWQAEYDAWVFQRDYDHRIEGGDSFAEVRRRFVSFIDDLVTAYSSTSQQILCISHGGIYSVMFPLLMKNVTPRSLLHYGFGYTSCIMAAYEAGGLQCVQWNDLPFQALEQ
jgi:broad specificity phosphatase PhoE